VRRVHRATGLAATVGGQRHHRRRQPIASCWHREGHPADQPRRTGRRRWSSSAARSWSTRWRSSASTCGARATARTSRAAASTRELDYRDPRNVGPILDQVRATAQTCQWESGALGPCINTWQTVRDPRPAAPPARTAAGQPARLLRGHLAGRALRDGVPRPGGQGGLPVHLPPVRVLATAGRRAAPDHRPRCAAGVDGAGRARPGDADRRRPPSPRGTGGVSHADRDERGRPRPLLRWQLVRRRPGRVVPGRRRRARRERAPACRFRTRRPGLPRLPTRCANGAASPRPPARRTEGHPWTSRVALGAVRIRAAA
jgi:hypothetical protein